MSATDIWPWIEELNAELSSAHDLITKLSTKLPLGPGNTEPSSSSQSDRVAQIRDRLKDCESSFELLQQQASDLQTEDTPIRHKESSGQLGSDVPFALAKLQETLIINKSRFRSAQLASKRAEEAATRRQREELFKGTVKRRGKQDRDLSKDLLLQASNDVTASLRRTHVLMTDELRRSTFAHETLENSTQGLRDLSEQYTDFDRLLKSSRNLISTLVQSQKSDTWYLESALFLLCGTIGWLLFRRVLYGPAWWFLYLPFKFLLRLVGFVIEAVKTSTGFSKSNVSPLHESLVSGTAPSAIISSLTSDILISSATVEAIHSLGTTFSAMSQITGSQSKSEQESKMSASAILSEKHDQSDSKSTSETVLRERREDEITNPKKRMWEEPSVQASSTETIKEKDEL